MLKKRILEKLNGEQQLAVKQTEGYVRVVAGAGSGKTRVLTHRYVYIAKILGVPPEHILTVTFTNKAANVMKSRIREFIPDEDGGWVGTFHSICRKILSFDIYRLNYPKNFKILDVDDQKDLLREIYQKNGLKLKNNTFNRILDEIEVYKSSRKYIPSLIKPEGVASLPDLCVEKDSIGFIVSEYIKAQRKNYYLDFADLIYFVLYLMETDKQFLNKWSEHFEYIQVDEFQDVSAEQYELVALLSSWHKNLFIVGDPDQTIYSFRGANVAYFLDFDKRFLESKTIILDKNYRSTPQILGASNSLIEHNENRIRKELKPIKSGGVLVEYYHAATRKEECRYIALRIEKLIKGGENPNEIAVFYRNNNNSRVVEEALIAQKVSYTILSGFAFYKRKEIKDAVAFLQMAETQDDISFLRTINEPPRGIGKTRLARLRAISELTGGSLYQALKSECKTPLFADTGAARYVEIIEKARGLKDNVTVLDLLDYFLKETGYEQMLMEDGEQERLDNVAELKDSIREQEKTAKEKVLLTDYLGGVALIMNVDRDSKKDSVKMLTAHASKGMEFKHVFVCQLNEGIFPSSKSNGLEEMEEERRLFYVAMTRAEEVLVLTDCERGTSGQNLLAPSRFLQEIDAKYLKKTGIVYGESLPKTQASKANGSAITAPLHTVGERVTHEIFGEGTIIGIQNGAYKIRFDYGKERTVSFKVKFI